jgi:hypothetical protein
MYSSASIRKYIKENLTATTTIGVLQTNIIPKQTAKNKTNG